ncbi:MAG: TIGR03032 family protein [Bacteroidales bacterium]|nr:TIGR03032 family protein [Bacteroidales bacterium]
MNAPKPFECEYPPQFAELLHNLNISLAISTYQAGKVVLLSPTDKDKLIQLPRTFENAMGMATKDDQLAISTQSKVEILKSSSTLAKKYIKKPNTYDHIYMPRASYHTGYLALHDMAFVKDKLVAVNTLFSSLSYIDDQQSFTPFWQPPFITDLMPEDRCHLNGMAIENDEIKYLTALGSTDVKQGWRENKINGGILMEYPSGRIILDNLSMPHSPRIFDGKLYLLNSAQGELIEVNPEKGTYEVIVNLGGFARGMEKIGEYLFIGVSKLRHNNDVFNDLPITKTSFAGVVAVHLPYKSIVSKIEYKMSVEEIYDVKILPNKLRPNILSSDMDVQKGAITFNEKSFWGEVKSEKQVKEEETNQQTNQQQPQQHKIRIQALQNLSPSDIYTQFHVLLCDDFKTELKNKTINKNQNLIIAADNNTPVGIIVFEASADKTIKINSVFVRSEVRKKGLATAMLTHLSRILEQNQINYTEASFNKEKIDVEITTKLFGKFSGINLLINE